MSICNYCMHLCDKCGMCTELKVLTSGRKKRCSSFLSRPEYACKSCAHIRYAYQTHQSYCTKRCVYIFDNTIPCNDFTQTDKDTKK